MTTPAIGTASLSAALTSNVVLPSQITTSIYSLSAIQAAQIAAPPPPVTPSVIVTGNVTMIPDAPGFTPIPTPLLASAISVNSIQSAATNTANAFGLNPITVSDTATIFQNNLQYQNALYQPIVVSETVIIPP